MLAPNEIIAAIKARYPNILIRYEDGRIMITRSKFSREIDECFIWILFLAVRDFSWYVIADDGSRRVVTLISIDEILTNVDSRISSARRELIVVLNEIAFVDDAMME